MYAFACMFMSLSAVRHGVGFLDTDVGLYNVFLDTIIERHEIAYWCIVRAWCVYTFSVEQIMQQNWQMTSCGQLVNSVLKQRADRQTKQHVIQILLDIK